MRNVQLNTKKKMDNVVDIPINADLSDPPDFTVTNTTMLSRKIKLYLICIWHNKQKRKK